MVTLQIREVTGANLAHLDARYIGFPLAAGIERAIRVALLSAGRASDATIRRRRAKGRTSETAWIDTKKFRNNLEIRWIGPDKYRIMAPADRMQNEKLRDNLRQRVPVTGNARTMIDHPEVQQGIEEVLDLMFEHADPRPE